MEYVTLFFTNEKGEGKYTNIFKFLFCCFKLPEFKEVKKRLNVKFIKSIEENSKDLIYGHIRNNSEF